MSKNQIDKNAQADAIREAAKAGLKQKQIAAIAGVSRGHVANIVIGARRAPKNALVPTSQSIASQNAPTSVALNRRRISGAELHQLIDDELNAQIALKNTITAYMVTKLIRAQNPDLEIKHEEVQARVHYYMQDFADYQMKWENWNGDQARTWRYIDPNPAKMVASKMLTIPSNSINWDE